MKVMTQINGGISMKIMEKYGKKLKTEELIVKMMQLVEKLVIKDKCNYYWIKKLLRNKLLE